MLQRQLGEAAEQSLMQWQQKPNNFRYVERRDSAGQFRRIFLYRNSKKNNETQQQEQE